MTKDEAIKRVEEIRLAAKDDDEMAHRQDDILRDDFIEFVAERQDELGEIARIILSTNDIQFSRWYA